AARGYRSAGPDGAEDQLAHRPPVLGPCKAVRPEPVGKDAVGRRAQRERRIDDLVEQTDRGLDTGGRRHRSTPRLVPMVALAVERRRERIGRGTGLMV